MDNVTILVIEQCTPQVLLKSPVLNVKLLNIPKQNPRGAVLVTREYEIPNDIRRISDCIVTKSMDESTTQAVVVCTSVAQQHQKQQQVSQLHYLPIKLDNFNSDSSKWQSVETNLPIPTKITKLTDSLFILTPLLNDTIHSQTENAIVYQIDNFGKPVMKYVIEKAFHVCLGRLNQETYLFSLYQDRNKLFKNLELKVYNLLSGQLASNLPARQFTLAEHHGSVESISVVMFNDVNGVASFRLILQTEDYAIQVVRQNGQQQWIREEALASIAAVEIVDLPVSETQAKMDDEFGHSNNNILEMFIRRLKTQTLQFVDRVKHLIFDLPYLITNLITSPSIAANLFSPKSAIKSLPNSKSADLLLFNPTADDPTQWGCVTGNPPRLCLIDFNGTNTVATTNAAAGGVGDGDSGNSPDGGRSSTSDTNPNDNMLNAQYRSKQIWEEFLTRDNFNIHKMLVVATSVGKIFGLESERGRVVWEHLVPSTKVLANQKLALFQQRNTAHFPLPPLMTLLLRSRTNNLPVLYSFNPITGAPSHDIGSDVYQLKHDILQAALQPGTPNEKLKFIRPILLLQTDLKVTLYPPQSSDISLTSINTKPLYIYTVENDLALITGYLVDLTKQRPQQQQLDENKVKSFTPSSSSSAKEDGEDRSMRAEFDAKLIWRISLSPDNQADIDRRHVIVAASHSPNEHIHSVGRVLGDRNVLYKYLNPNLIAVLTVGGHLHNHTNSVNLYLIDVVTGRVLHNAVHRRCTEPVSLVHSENWILYTYYNHKSLRNEITVLELYEPVNPITGELCTDNIIPSPWQLFLSNLIQANWLTSLPFINQFQQLQQPHNHLFSSMSRASDMWKSNNNRCGGGGGQQSRQSALSPQILQQSYIITTPPRGGDAAAVSITERGITSKSVIFGLQKNGLIELAKHLFDPRRTLDMTPELIEEGVHPYTPVLPLSDKSMISYNQSVMRIRSIRTAPTGLESTGLVFAYGLDLFFTRIAPSQTYDLLKEDFDYIAIATVTTGMIIASLVTSRLATRRAIVRAWA